MSVGGGRIASRVWLLWLLGLLAVAVGSLLPQVAPPGGLHADKLVHLVAYAGLAVIPGLLVRRVPIAILVCIALVLMGGAIELAQSYVPGRVASSSDIAANLIGVAIGWLVGRRIRAVAPKPREI